ncbi:MAG: ATP-grasp domain-containing protein [Anaerolineae bacterium]|nr:ATP-grasp domain-containing protein [Anaerolineae bacterium]
MLVHSQIAGGLALLDDFIRSCAFLHDDWTDHEGVGGWGQYTTNPLLFSPPVCVTSSLAGYGPRTIDQLRSLGGFQGRIIQPEWRTNNLALNLRSDLPAMAALREQVQAQRLHLSSFYNDPGRGIDAIADSLSSSDHTVQAHPSHSAFMTMYSKLRFSDYVDGVPSPQGATCETLADLKAFARDSARAYPGMVIKLDHRDLFHLDSADDIDGIADQLKYPLRVETEYPLVATPIVNAIRWKGQVAPLFMVDQYIRDWLHWGNGSPASGTAEQRARMIEYTLRIGEQMEGYEGVFGVDFIHTPDGAIYAVDINARFCSSTYPYGLLTRAGIDPDRTHTRYRLVPCRLDSLDDLTTDPEFIGLTAGGGCGIFAYDPVAYFELPHPVHYVNYVCVAPTAAACLALDETMTRIIARHTARHSADD